MPTRSTADSPFRTIKIGEDTYQRIVELTKKEDRSIKAIVERAVDAYMKGRK